MIKDPKYAVLQKVRDNRRTFGITPRIPGGFVKPEELIKLAEVAQKYNGTIKITSGQRIAILGLEADDVDKVWSELGMEPAVLSTYSVKNVEMCPAAFCKRAKQNSLKLAMHLEKRFYGASTPNRTKIGVAGCRNSCTSAYSKDIAVIGDIKGYIVAVGGSAGYHPKLPNIIAENLSEKEAYEMVESVYEYYNKEAQFGEKLGDFVERVSVESFKNKVIEIFKDRMNRIEK
ncbi:NAD(P)/FAD-dependent oxidoreductase [Clostridium polyendosporum]|uniref:NAD(P)/FAD-dependent oxidoreductase n=1 Tax=Clostridium polyendosporum TaxID=69208 RepID=A0A919S188_9CLOT|nr:NAD(P)/FAD-dependent oxidoreductase [Clostridium polyendosporum]GIM29947.1 NAD(P)/FAD-dependent oxidoreductase [Clostridium polyendosporum]